MREHDPHLEEAMRRLGSTVGTVLESASPAVRIAGTTTMGINGEDVERLTDCFQMILAEAIQAWIDAIGSERDAVMENDELHDAIANELRGWSTDWDKEA